MVLAMSSSFEIVVGFKMQGGASLLSSRDLPSSSLILIEPLDPSMSAEAYFSCCQKVGMLHEDSLSPACWSFSISLKRLLNLKSVVKVANSSTFKKDEVGSGGVEGTNSSPDLSMNPVGILLESDMVACRRQGLP